MESNEFPLAVEDERARKRKRNIHAWKRSRTKAETYSDFLLYILHSNRNILAALVSRYTQKNLPKKAVCAHKSKALQCNILTHNDVTSFAEGFYKSKDKAAQDSFILSYCRIEPPIRKDRGKKRGSRKQITITYTIRRANGRLAKVCQQLFRGVLNVGKDRIQRVCKRHLDTGEAPREFRGGDRKSGAYFAKKQPVIEFIKKKNKCIEVHYCRGKTKRQYFPSELSDKLHSMYSEQVADTTLHVKRSYFRFVFNTNFNIGFKAPAADVCSTCTMLKESIKFEKDADRKQTAMNRLIIHKRRLSSNCSEKTNRTSSR